ncbi:Rhomboid-like protein 15 [Camellia lanceoleosa]|uniref:Rhomboid-like protein 15 n=1 Tax=Camellia lanceoleosa TaxID=1840588 RepID=A0ACC0G870_9ERIC|nr:Rhomboid-like protein 15 [Camellia lanceoleosa]
MEEGEKWKKTEKWKKRKKKTVAEEKEDGGEEEKESKKTNRGEEGVESNRGEEESKHREEEKKESNRTEEKRSRSTEKRRMSRSNREEEEEEEKTKKTKHIPGGGIWMEAALPSFSAFDGATAAAAGVLAHHQGSVVSEEEIQKLVEMGFERTQVEVAVAAADGDLNVAVEILMSQLG